MHLERLCYSIVVESLQKGAYAPKGISRRGFAVLLTSAEGLPHCGVCYVATFRLERQTNVKAEKVISRDKRGSSI
ncbi:hypothetical protein HK104_004033 [Borealophlyctis nickersoniae]|nr:hypothetical protein HK104_004033 [Borealophlyctis nickersoniae]